MRKYLTIVFLFLIFMAGCKNKQVVDEPKKETPKEEHVCINILWELDENYTCLSYAKEYGTCTDCKKEFEREIYLGHDFEEIEVLPTCSKEGKKGYKCKKCDFEVVNTLAKFNHVGGAEKIVKVATKDSAGIKEVACKNCFEVIKRTNYFNNGFLYHGTLSVKGADLVNEKDEKVQLFGLSTHGIHWFPKFINEETISSLQNEFGINVIRFALYTAEGGYCEATQRDRLEMKENLYKGIDIATSLGMYVIVDWHMVGATDVNDKNPLTYLDEAKEFFKEVASKYQNQNNILFEIMNEPNGDTTWDDCKEYANEVIPIIREYSDGIILVGNPKWTSDLASVMASPLEGYENIMYTYHFYAASHKDTSTLTKAYDQGFPVFVSEFAFTESSGDGKIDPVMGELWFDALNKRNISYVSWNISNSKGQASIFKYNTENYQDASDANLKPWGIMLKKFYRKLAGIVEEN